MRAALSLACLAMLLLAAPVAAGSPAVWPSLAPGTTLHGRFIQVQHLHGLTAPLTTEGDFVVAPTRGIIWRSTQPVRSVTVITATGLRRLVNDHEVQRIASAHTPAFAHLYLLLDRAMAGDWSALQEDFAVESSGDHKAWQVVLTPLRATGPLAAHITSVALTGDGRLDSVAINRANGDSERVTFLDQVVSSAPLAEPEAALLNDERQ